MYQVALKVNQAKDTDTNPANNPPKLNWKTFFTHTVGLTPASIPQVDNSVDIEAQGSLILDAFGVVMAKGSFKVQLGTVIDKGADGELDGPAATDTTQDDTSYQAMALTLGKNAFTGASPVEVFIGVGGELEDNPGGTSTPTNYSDDQLNLESGVGFHATLDELSLVTLKNNNKTPTNATDDKSYLGLDLSGLSAELLGIGG